MSDALRYDKTYWDSVLPATERPKSDRDKLHLLFSLIVYLGLSLSKILHFTFTSQIKSVKERAGVFLAVRKRPGQPERFAPAEIYELWHKYSPQARGDVHDRIIRPCMEEIAVMESDLIIKEKSFKVRLRQLTIAGMRALLDPTAVAAKVRSLAPFTYSYLHAFTASPNRYRQEHLKKEKKEAEENLGTSHLPRHVDDNKMGLDVGDDSEVEEASDDVGVGHHGGSDEGAAWQEGYPGFSRNPMVAIITAIMMLAFVRNRATNALALPLGLFFGISGTSSRVLGVLSNIGLSVSVTTIEETKARISEDAIKLAIALITSGVAFYILFDNINLYLRKFQERLTNRASMIHATNSAVVALHGVDKSAMTLQTKLDRWGERAKATFADVRPTALDGEHMEGAFQCLIGELLVRYTPGSNEWEGRSEMLRVLKNAKPKDRPLQPVKTDTRPFGVFDVNEGSKKGVIDVLKDMQVRSTLTEEEWAGKTRIMQGDWLTSRNLRIAKRERVDDYDRMERLEYVEESSALWHFALQATHMLMRVHFGHATVDPTSLAAHKGLLHRTWDATKPNYAAAKALIRHSLIARLLHCVIVLKGYNTWDDLKSWRPSHAEIRQLSRDIEQHYTRSEKAVSAQDNGDDWLAHSIYFIRDALFFCEFEDAVANADAGRVLRVLKYWAFAFEGAGQHNYARECVEVHVKWKYEVDVALRDALEKAWFVNRWGQAGRWIAADLYLEQCNFWVKRVFVASGNAVTIEYIMAKGSASAEAFRENTHLVANFFGDPDRPRRHKEIVFTEDMQALVEEMIKENVHTLSRDKPRMVPAPPSKSKAQRNKSTNGKPKSAVVDVFDIGARAWQNGKFNEYIKTTTYDPALACYPGLTDPKKTVTSESASESSVLDNGTVFDNREHNVLSYDSYIDLHGDELVQQSNEEGMGALGGGGEFDTGEEVEST